MATTYTLINSTAVGSGGTATVTFSSIPATYTDLKLVISQRFDANNTGSRMRFNGDTGANYSWIRLQGNGSGAFSDSSTSAGSPYNTFIYLFPMEASSYTASTFCNTEVYLPNYASSNYKSLSIDGVAENNATTAPSGLMAGLWSSGSAINSISMTIDGSGNYSQYSTFYLYGISNS